MLTQDQIDEWESAPPRQKPALPETMLFRFPNGKLMRCFYEVLGFSEPKKGEMYVSGAIPSVYVASRDFPEGAKYWLVKPTHKMKRVESRAIKGDPL